MYSTSGTLCLHRLMIEEVISSGYAPEGISAVRFLKNNPEMIKNMTLAWDIFSILRSIGNKLISGSPTTPNRTFHISQTCQVLLKDSAIATIAQEAGITQFGWSRVS